VPTFATRTRRASAAAVVLALGFAGALVAAPAANAATITVTSSADAGAGTLRQAVLDANSGAFPGGDTIQFAPAVTSITLASPIVVTEALNLYGPGAAALQISRNGDFEMFEFDMAAAGQNVGIDGIRFDGGLGTTQRGLDFLANNPVQNLTISDSEFQVFQTSVRGGAVNIEELTGNFILVSTDFHDNASLANVNVASIYAEDIDAGFTSISDCDFYGNTGESGSGLEIMFSSTDLVIADSTFSDNQSTNAGAGAFFYGLDSVTIRDTTFRNDDVSSNSAGALYVSNSGSVSVEDSAFSDSDTLSGNGGAMVADTVDGLEIIDTSFTNNSAANMGGALYVHSAGTVDISGSAFTLNTTSAGGGALAFGLINDTVDIDTSLFDSNSTLGNGGAINAPSVSQQVNVRSTTFVGNVATNGPGGASGAAIYAGEITAGAELLLDSSTFSEQFVDTGVFGTGGGESVAVGTIRTDGRLFVLQSTLFEDANGAAGAIFADTIESDGDLLVHSSTIVADGALRVGNNLGGAAAVNSIVYGDANNIGTEAIRLDAGTPIGIAYDIISSAFDLAIMVEIPFGTNQFSVVDPGLSALANNGGPTETMLPLATSPAVDAGLIPFPTPPNVDQRGAGFPRVLGGRVDIGALETGTLLAATGLNISPLVPIGAAVVVLLGVGLLILARRRRAV
jgi:predicted outer membrane repeat protein